MRRIIKAERKNVSRIVTCYQPKKIKPSRSYYNIMNLGDGMIDKVFILRHDTLSAAIKDAKEAVTCLKYHQPRCLTGGSRYSVRTVKFLEMHRAEAEFMQLKGGKPVLDAD